MTPAFDRLAARFARLSRLEGALAMLDWDASAMMPEGSQAARADDMAELRLVIHELLADPALEDAIAQARSEPLDALAQADLTEMHRARVHAAAVPGDLVAASARAASACEMRWRAARKDNDFKGLMPLLKEVVALTRQVADAKAVALGVAPYDALLDAFEPDGRAAAIDAVFADLAAFLPPFIDAVIERQARLPAPVAPAGPFPPDRQKALAESLMRRVGFDFSRGRLDTSAHPFCGGIPEDVRITTRWDEANFLKGLLGVLHETGHALYESGLPQGWRGRPIGRARGMTLHESQSLTIEMQAARHPAFVGWLAPVAAEAFDRAGDAAFAPDNLTRLVTQVKRSLIRVDADEATYPAHVILRFRLEQAMLSGDLAVDDLPGAWREGMGTLLGVVPDTDREGCLQDIHWPSGAFGYFPTYTLGALAAAQIFEAAVADDPSIPLALGRGDFTPLTGFLRRAIHTEASRDTTDAILTRATGRPLDAKAFARHLKRRYLDA